VTIFVWGRSRGKRWRAAGTSRRVLEDDRMLGAAVGLCARGEALRLRSRCGRGGGAGQIRRRQRRAAERGWKLLRCASMLWVRGYGAGEGGKGKVGSGGGGGGRLLSRIIRL
jgi:hypothetical protein